MTGHADEAHNGVPAALTLCIEALGHTPAALITDIDGTISEVAPTPEEASVLPEAREALRRLQRSLAFVGVVTGRAAATGVALVDVPGLVVIGNHGLERSDGTASVEHPDAVSAVDSVARALERVQTELDARGAGTGVLYENKRLSSTIHYRLATDPASTKATLLEVVKPIAMAEALRVTEGRFIIELRPQIVVNKGTAVADLIRDQELRGVVFFGDDTTDVDAFRAVRAARKAGTLAGVCVGVTAAETPAAIIDESDVTVAGVAACAALLSRLADYFERARPNG